MPRSPEEDHLNAQLAVETMWARTPDRTARTAPGRAAVEARFLAEAGGDPQRAAHLRKAHYHRLALKSVRSRRLAREAADQITAMTAAAEEAEAELAELGADDE